MLKIIQNFFKLPINEAQAVRKSVLLLILGFITCIASFYVYRYFFDKYMPFNHKKAFYIFSFFISFTIFQIRNLKDRILLQLNQLLMNEGLLKEEMKHVTFYSVFYSLKTNTKDYALVQKYYISIMLGSFFSGAVLAWVGSIFVVLKAY